MEMCLGALRALSITVMVADSAALMLGLNSPTMVQSEAGFRAATQLLVWVKSAASGLRSLSCR